MNKSESSGLNMFMKYIFSFLSIMLSESIIKYFGSLSEQEAIYPLTGIIRRFYT